MIDACRVLLIFIHVLYCALYTNDYPQAYGQMASALRDATRHLRLFSPLDSAADAVSRDTARPTRHY